MKCTNFKILLFIVFEKWTELQPEPEQPTFPCLVSTADGDLFRCHIMFQADDWNDEY